MGFRLSPWFLGPLLLACVLSAAFILLRSRSNEAQEGVAAAVSSTPPTATAGLVRPPENPTPSVAPRPSPSAPPEVTPADAPSPALAGAGETWEPEPSPDDPGLPAPTVPPPPPPPPAPPTPTPDLSGPLTCDNFWARQPSSGAGLNHDFEAMIVSLQNQERARRGLPPLIGSPALYGIAAGYAQYVAENRWWEIAPDVHTSGAGVTFEDRMFGSGAVDPGGGQTVGPSGQAWSYIGENVFWGDGFNPCQSFANLQPIHVANYTGTVNGSLYPTVYDGTACYAIYSSRTFACVQDFVDFR